MSFSKPIKRLQPIQISSLTKRNTQVSTNSKRTIPLRPITIANHQMLKLDCINDVVEVNRRKSKNKRIYIKQTMILPGKGFDNMILKPQQSKTRATSINSILHKKVGLTHQQLYQRKESNLNTYFNIRMNKLKDITKENKRIYERLNSQKSLYSSRNLDQSFQENCNISRRLSESKMSRANSICSISNKKSNRKISLKNVDNKVNKVSKQIKLQSHNIKDVGQGEAKRYLQIFCNNNSNRQAYNKKNIITQSLSKNMKRDKQNKELPNKYNLQGIIQQFKVNSRKPISLARLL